MFSIKNILYINHSLGDGLGFSYQNLRMWYYKIYKLFWFILKNIVEMYNIIVKQFWKQVFNQWHTNGLHCNRLQQI